MLGFVIQNHPHRSGANLGGKLVRRFARHGSSFSELEPPANPGRFTIMHRRSVEDYVSPTSIACGWLCCFLLRS
jgi:hypothetical protein